MFPSYWLECRSQRTVLLFSASPMTWSCGTHERGRDNYQSYSVGCCYCVGMGGADATPSAPVTEVPRIAERLVIGGGTVQVVEVGGTGAIEGDSITNRATVGPIGVRHRSIVFHYTPKHTSWMNQVEIWLSILVRKLLQRGSFRSVTDLKQKVLDFIDY